MEFIPDPGIKINMADGAVVLVEGMMFVNEFDDSGMSPGGFTVVGETADALDLDSVISVEVAGHIVEFN